jgi:hypothetical protein
MAATTQLRLPPARHRRRRSSLRSTLAAAVLTAVVVASGVTALSLQQAEGIGSEFVVLEPVVRPSVTPPTEIVTAPPLRPVGQSGPNPSATDTHAMGASSACPHCGVVQTVVAVHDEGRTQASGYLMNIRMDDGSIRTVQHRGAFAAGSRVAVEGTKLSPAP